MASAKLFVILGLVNFVYLQKTGSGTDGNLRLCVVEGRGSYKMAPKYCPILDEEKAGVECVIGTDRLDCLRRIGKGTVDFGVFSPEDLVAAQWSGIDVLVTTEMRHRSRPFERSIVAVINRRILPDSVTSVNAILQNTTLCHPGVATDDIRPLSDTLGEYLESLVAAKSCDPKLSLAENRVKTLSEFFRAACKAGSWVQDKERDAELKRRYPNLCAACGSSSCSAGDRYWGDAGALNCMYEGAGDVTWAVLDDVNTYFRLTAKPDPLASHFAFLCLDGSWQPLTGNPSPCVWLNRPWPVIVAKRKASEAVSTLTSALTNSSVTVEYSWRGALSLLLESNQALPEPLQPAHAPLDYLSRARGFRDAYSQSGCNPTRHITLCSASRLAKYKCEWLSEAGSVYGVVPPLQCSYRDHLQECMRDVSGGEADVAVGGSDWLVPGIRDYNLKPLLHEVTPIVEKTSTVVAYVRSDDNILKMADLRGKRVVFPRFDGLAWHAILKTLSEKQSDSCSHIINDYFSEICAPGIESYNVTMAVKEKLTKNCFREGEVIVDGEIQALRSLVEGKSDVAFISMNTYNRYKANQIQEAWAMNQTQIKPICPEDNQQYCFISWSSIGHIFARKYTTSMRRQEIINVFKSLDQLFGKHYPFHTAMFSMYGSFNHVVDVLFHNNTRRLATDEELTTHPFDKIPMNFERQFLNTKILDNCHNSLISFGNYLMPGSIVLAISLVFSLIQM